MGPIKAKFDTEPQWDGGTKVCSRGLGHMTKMATTPMYGKNPSKIFFSRSKRPMTLWLGMWHWGLGPIKVSSSLRLFYFTARSNLISYAFIWGKLLESHLIEETYSKWPEWQEVLCLYKNSDPKGLSAPAPGLYTCIKTWKIIYKIRLQRYFFETCNKWAKWQGFSVDIRILSTKGCLSLPRGYIHLEKH